MSSKDDKRTRQTPRISGLMDSPTPTATTILNLPYELLWEIGELLLEASNLEDDGSKAFQGLVALRSTCKSLVDIYRPLIFSHLDTAKWKEKPSAESDFCLANLSQYITSLKIAPILTVQTLTPTLDHPTSSEDLYTWPTQLLTEAVNVTEIRVKYTKNVDLSIKHMQKLRSLKFEGYWQVLQAIRESIPVPSWSSFFWEVSENQLELESLRISRFQLTSKALETIKKNFANLRYLEVLTAINVECREEFGKLTTWACGQTLHTLILSNCGGAHSTYIASLITGGVFPQLRRCILDTCGDYSDDTNITPPPHTEWKHSRPCLDYLEIEHFNDWELQSLSRIRTRHLRLLQIDELDMYECFERPEAFGQTLELIEGSENRWRCFRSKDMDEELQEICVKRNIRLVLE